MDRAIADVISLSDAGNRNQENKSWIGQTIDEELDAALGATWTQQLPSHGCRLAETGDFFVRALLVLSRLASLVILEGRIEEELKTQADDLANEPDLGTTAYLDEKEAALRSVATEMVAASARCHDAWLKSLAPVPPEPTLGFGQQHNPGEAAQADQMFDIAPHGSPIQASHDQNHPMAEEPQATSQATTQNEKRTVPDGIDEPLSLSEPLKHRGKGPHFCPYGQNCRKGGINADGSLKMFLRNSDFR
jgi:hypothetical protein